MTNKADSINHCGTCTMCCKLLGVHDIEPVKPVSVWCPHCKIGQGCGIYESRPPSCQTYVCVWLQYREEGHDISDALRPDRCGVIIDAAADGSCHYARCDPAKPDAWKRPAVQNFIAFFAAAGPLGLVVGDRLQWLKE